METKPVQPFFFCHKERLLELPGVHGRSADISGLPGCDHIVQSRHCFFDRRVIIPTVDNEQVYKIDAHARQAFIDIAHNGFAGQAGIVWPFMHFAEHLGGDHHFIPVGVILEGTAQNFLAGAVCIHIGRIKKINP